MSGCCTRSGAAARVMAAAWALLAASATAQAPPLRVVEIVFEGNEVTRDATLRRELRVAPGDVYDGSRAEEGRQALQDLRLFRAVYCRAEPTGDGMRLVYSVVEKWYWQGYPRLSANSDGQNSLGAELRVNNLWGLNHSLRLLGRSRDSRDADGQRDLSLRGSYTAPFALGARDSLRLSFAHNVVPNIEPVSYDETVDEAEILLTHSFETSQQSSQGWSLGLGPVLRDHRTSDETVARSFGSSYGAVAELGYRDWHDRVFSDDGTQFTLRYELASRDLLSDYSYSVLRAAWEHARPLGGRTYQQLGYGLSLGLANNGLDHHALFSLGGTEGLKGYERRAFEGNSYYLAHVELMRPLLWDSLRGTLGLEFGNAGWVTKDLFDTPNVSLNFGLRFRPRRLMNFEIELGFAIPLGGDDPRFYGGKVDAP
jgi:outer membrane protein assembly factor BamA